MSENIIEATPEEQRTFAERLRNGALSGPHADPWTVGQAKLITLVLVLKAYQRGGSVTDVAAEIGDEYAERFVGWAALPELVEATRAFPKRMADHMVAFSHDYMEPVSKEQAIRALAVSMAVLGD